jgi:hypothetical protein
LGQGFSPTYTPDQKDRLQQLSASVVNNITERRREAATEAQSRRDIAKEKEMQKGRMDVQEATRVRAEAVAWIHAGVKTNEMKMKIESVVSDYLHKKFDGKPTTPQEDEAFKWAQQIMTNVRAAGAATMADPSQLSGKLLNIPLEPRGVPTPVGPENPPAGAPTTGGDALTQQQVESAGYHYDNKYEYRMEGGKMKRKPK